jgi:hypothetical protein
MQHFADFGYVRQANKQLKRLYDLQGTKIAIPDKSRLNPATLETGLGNISGNLTKDFDKGLINTIPKNTLNQVNLQLEEKLSRKRAIRQSGLDKQDPLSRPIRHSYNEYDAPAVLPKTGWSDIRKTDDRAASPTGYLGFRTDPYKGYGGMMEEPIPKPDLYPDGMPQTVKKYASRLSRKEVN